MKRIPSLLIPLLVFVISCKGKEEDTSCYEGFERNEDGACMAENRNNGSPSPADGGETSGDGAGDTDGSASGGSGGTSAGADTTGGTADGGTTGTADGGTTGTADGGTTGTADGGMTDGVADGSTSSGGTVGGDATGGTVGGDETGGTTGGGVVDPCAGREVGTEIGQCAENFTLMDADGVEVSLYDFYGQVIVLDLSGFG